MSKIKLNEQYIVQRGELAESIITVTTTNKAVFDGKEEVVYGDGTVFFRESNLKPLVETIKPENVKTVKSNS